MYNGYVWDFTLLDHVLHHFNNSYYNTNSIPNNLTQHTTLTLLAYQP